MEPSAPVNAPRFDELVHRPNNAVTRYSYFDPTEAPMRDLAEEVISGHWKHVVLGPGVEGAVFDVCFTEQPGVRISDGYLRIDPGAWHFHLCLGPHSGSSSEELRRMRPLAKVDFVERRGKGCAAGQRWRLRMWNGTGEQMTTVYLPNPRLTDDMQLLTDSDWVHSDLCYQLRQRLLGEPLPHDFGRAAHVALTEPA